MQTPATFDAIMAGARKRIELQAEGDLATAHAAAQFSALAAHGKLKPVKYYLTKPDPIRGLALIEHVKRLKSQHLEGA